MQEFILQSGLRIPAVGFGTYNPKKQDMTELITRALRLGYRFLDTASLYETERNVGEAIRKTGVARKDIIIESKLWYDEMGYQGAKEAIDRSLARIGTDYLDLMLIHWPRATGKSDEDWKTLDLETWRAMEEAVKVGKVREIGCSNFLPHHLENLLLHADVKPAVDQLELHIGYTQEAAVEYCKQHGIQVISWGPLGRGRMNKYVGAEYVKGLAGKYGKSEKQIFLRFLVQKNIIVIAKATSEEHMRSNIGIFDFSLTEEEMWFLQCMPETAWMGEHPDFAIPAKHSNPDQ